MSLALDRISGSRGTYFLEVTTAHTGKLFSMLQINTDAVFTTLTITIDGAQGGADTTEDALTTQNLTARTVSQGSILTAPEGSWFSAVTMSSGTAIGVVTNR